MWAAPQCKRSTALPHGLVVMRSTFGNQQAGCLPPGTVITTVSDKLQGAVQLRREAMAVSSRTSDITVTSTSLLDLVMEQQCEAVPGMRSVPNDSESVCVLLFELL